MQTVARELFKNADAQFINERHRPDIVVLPDKTTFQITGTESFDPADPTLTKLQNILLIELKKGGFSLTRKEVNQADGYVQDIASSGALSGSPYICAWVVGQKVTQGIGTDKRVGDGNREYGRLRATTFGSLVDTANLRLMRMRELLSGRYADIGSDELVSRVLEKPVQKRF